MASSTQKRSNRISEIFDAVAAKSKNFMGFRHSWNAMKDSELASLSDQIASAISEQKPGNKYPTESSLEASLKSWQAQINQCRKISSPELREGNEKIISSSAARDAFCIRIQKSIFRSLKNRLS